MKNYKEFTPSKQQIDSEAMDLFRRVNFILKRIRLTERGMMQEFKGEAAKDTVKLQRVEFPKEGGVLTYFEDVYYPSKGFPYFETVDRIDEVKRIGMEMAWALNNILKGNKVKVFLFLVVLKEQVNELFKRCIFALHSIVKVVVYKPEMYCPSVREIYRSFDVFLKELESEKEELWVKERDKGKMGDAFTNKTMVERLRDVGCMVLEADDAYRYRVQLAFSKLDKTALNKDPTAEILRLLNILISKETKVVERWKALESVVKTIFLFRPEIKELAKRFFNELDIEKIRMDEADEYHASLKSGFNWDKNKEDCKALEEKRKQEAINQTLKINQNVNDKPMSSPGHLQEEKKEEPKEEIQK